MDTYNFYYGLIVEESHMDNAFAWAEEADQHQNYDEGRIGIVIPHYDVGGSPPTPPGLKSPTSWTPEQQTPTPNWEVRVHTGYAYDKDGVRVAVDPPTTVSVDCEYDYLSVSNAVSAGKERWISLFLFSKKTLSDPQVDDGGSTVYFQETESYEIKVYQAAEETAPATTKPTLLSDAILIVDINVDENAGSNGLLDGDMNFDRTEFLVNLDLSTPFGGSAYVHARNLEEALYALAVQVAAFTGTGGDFLERDGGNTITGNIDPDASGTRSLGASNPFLAVKSRRLLEEPSASSTAGYIRPQSDWDTGGSGHIQAVKEYIDFEDFVRRFLDVRGRMHKNYHEEIEDFLHRNGWTGTIGTDTSWRQTLTGSGSTSFNPSTYAQTLPNGFLKVDCSTATSDAVEIYRDAYIGFARQLFTMEWATYVDTVNSSSIVFWGFKSPSWNYVGFVYDPAGTWNPGSANDNIWAVYDDGTNTAIWVDTGVGMTAFDDTLQLLTVGFEVDGTGDLLCRWYINRSEEHEFNLTDGGGTYETVAEAGSFDLLFDLIDNNASPTSVVLLDYFRILCMRQTLGT